MSSTHETIEYSRTPDRNVRDLVNTAVHTGTIIEVDYDEDTADVNIDGIVREDIPIFYHCERRETRSSGSSAFKGGDSVYILEKPGTVVLPEYIIVGFVDGLKSCGWLEDWENLISESGLSVVSSSEGRYTIKTDAGHFYDYSGGIWVAGEISRGHVNVYEDTIATVVSGSESEVLKMNPNMSSLCRGDSCPGSLFCVETGGYYHCQLSENCDEGLRIFLPLAGDDFVFSMDKVSGFSFKFYLDSMYPDTNSPVVSSIWCPNTTPPKWGPRKLGVGLRLNLQLIWQHKITKAFDFYSENLIVINGVKTSSWDWYVIAGTSPPSAYSYLLNKWTTFTFEDFQIPYGDGDYVLTGMYFYTTASVRFSPYPDNWPGVYLKFYIDDIQLHV